MTKPKQEQELQNKTEKAYQLSKQNAEHVWALLDEEIKQPEALVKLIEEDLIYPNSIIMIQGKEGTHKSRLAAALTSLLISDNPDDTNMGFRKADSNQYHVLYLDTERNKTQQLPMMLQQIHRNLGLQKSELRKHITIAPLSEISRNDRISVMGKYFQNLPKKDDDTVIIVIDIVSDFISDFNNLVQSNQLLDLMNSASGKISITFIVVIHENPGASDKARGHLGTELANKASTVLQISSAESGDLFKLHVKKSRMTAKGKTVYLKYDLVTNNLVPASDVEITEAVKDLELSRLIDFFQDEPPFTEMTRTELLARITKQLRISDRTAESKLKLMVEKRIEFEILFGQERAYLEKSRGKNTSYFMKTVNSSNDAKPKEA
jgi:hypothetical protein